MAEGCGGCEWMHVSRAAQLAGERRNDLHFRMLDQRSNTPVRYERVLYFADEAGPADDHRQGGQYFARRKASGSSIKAKGSLVPPVPITTMVP